MTAPIGPGGTGGTPAAGPDRAERLRRTARDLEGVFVEQLFKAMRETVPTGGLVEGGSGEEMFTALLDQKMSAVAPARWQHGLSEALMRQLGGRGDGSSPPSPAPILHLNDLPDASPPEPS